MARSGSHAWLGLILSVAGCVPSGESQTSLVPATPFGGVTAPPEHNKAAFTPDPQGHVLAEMDGPGCVMRIWSANPGDAGNVRI